MIYNAIFSLYYIIDGIIIKYYILLYTHLGRNIYEKIFI